jgi:hypothetical protein
VIFSILWCLLLEICFTFHSQKSLPKYINPGRNVKSARGSVRNIATMFTQVDIIFGLSSKHWSWIHTKNSWIWKEDHPKNFPARIDIFWQWFLRRMKCETNLQQQASQNRKYHTWKTVLSTWHQWHAEGSGDCPKYPFQGASNQREKKEILNI